MFFKKIDWFRGIFDKFISKKIDRFHSIFYQKKKTLLSFFLFFFSSDFGMDFISCDPSYQRLASIPWLNEINMKSNEIEITVELVESYSKELPSNQHEELKILNSCFSILAPLQINGHRSFNGKPNKYWYSYYNQIWDKSRLN